MKKIVGSGFVGMGGLWKEKLCQVVIVNVYSSCDASQKRRLWEYLKAEKANSNVEMWCLIGDFNCEKGGRDSGCRGGREKERVQLVPRRDGGG